LFERYSTFFKSEQTLHAPLFCVCTNKAAATKTKLFKIIPERQIYLYPVSETFARPLDGSIPALQISLDLCIPEKELAKTRSQISFIYFQKHS